MSAEKKFEFRINKSEKTDLINLISSKVGNAPFIVHEKNEGNNEITLTIISASFTPSQQKELDNLKDQIMTGTYKLGKAQEVFNLFD